MEVQQCIDPLKLKEKLSHDRGLWEARSVRRIIDQIFGEIANGGQSPAHVAIKCAVAHGQFTFVAGGDH